MEMDDGALLDTTRVEIASQLVVVSLFACNVNYKAEYE